MNKHYIYGFHAVEAALSKPQTNVLKLFYLKGRHDHRLQEILTFVKNNNIAFEPIELRTLEGFVGHVTHQGIAAEIKSAEARTENELYELLDSLKVEPLLLILDGVQDPHNLGACLRTADAVGVHAVIVPKDNAVGLTPAVRKVASGAAETVPFFQVTNLARTMRELKARGIWMIGAASEATDNLFKENLSGPKAIVMGAEGEGLRRLTKENCDHLLYIPMKGNVGSLNVSVATGIFLFEAIR